MAKKKKDKLEMLGSREIAKLTYKLLENILKEIKSIKSAIRGE